MEIILIKVIDQRKMKNFNKFKIKFSPTKY